jgi:hypothetical protein
MRGRGLPAKSMTVLAAPTQCEAEFVRYLTGLVDYPEEATLEGQGQSATPWVFFFRWQYVQQQRDGARRTQTWPARPFRYYR